MELLQRLFIRSGEGRGELELRIRLALFESFASEIKSAEKPEETLGCGGLFFSFLGLHERLQRIVDDFVGLKAGAYFLKG